MFTRRTMLQASVATALLGGLPRVRAEASRSSASSTEKPPRYFVTIFLRGGIDAVYTTDPKTAKDVEARVDVPYTVDGIVDTGKMQLGPHFKPLAKYADDMCILRGVQVATANHESGAYQIVRMRTAVQPNMPSLHDIIGARREDQPLASVTMGKLASFEHSPGGIIAPTGEPSDALTSLDAIDELSDDEADMLAKSFAKHLKEIPSSVTGRAAVTRDHVEQAQKFFARLTKVKRFKEEDWGTKSGDVKRAAEDLQRTLWFLENDLAKGVMAKIQFDWDSHFRNADKQTYATSDFTHILTRFLDGLHEKKNAYGTLAEQTVVVVTSELGRFPIINGNLGKDHFPEVQMVLFGPGLNTGKAFVPTGKMMEGQPIDLKTGLAKDGGDYVFLDDVGATLLHMAGVKPELYGYSGRRLPFLERA